MGERTTVVDVARRASVSPSTVSRVFNGVTNVDPDLVKRVRKAAAELSYVPNPYGRALRRQRSESWTVIVADLQNPFYTQLVAVIESIANEQGFSVLICVSDEDLEKERRHIQVAVSQHIAGVVISPSSESHTDLSPLARAGIPVVVVDRQAFEYSGASVMTDNQQVGVLAAQHLLERGYRHPAIVTSAIDIWPEHGRVRGFVETFRSAGIEIPDSRVYPIDVHAGASQDRMRQMLAENPDLDALYTVNGPLTASAFLFLETAGIAIPGDVALLGVDDNEWTSMVTPAVTVVRQPVSEVGRIAAELLSQPDGLSRFAGARVVLPPELVVRSST